MSISKRLLSVVLSLCLVFGSCLVFSGVAYADYEGLPNNGMYNVTWYSDPYLSVRLSKDWSSSSSYVIGKKTNSSVYFTPSFSGSNSVWGLSFVSFVSEMNFTYAPDLYDYYFLATVGFPSGSFVPNGATFHIYDSSNVYGDAALLDFSVYRHSDDDSTGFTVFGKVPHLDTTSLVGFSFYNDVSAGSVGSGTVYVDGLFIAVDKSVSSTSDALTEIILRLDQVNSNLVSGAAGIQSVIQSQTQHDQQLWDDTYNPDQTEAEDTIAGVGREYVTLLEEGLGAVTYFEQVTTAVIDIFYNPNLGDPLIPFPGFNISVGGTTSTVWEPMTVNLAEVLEPFGPLLTAVRFANLFMVWSALLGYFTKVFNEILRR